MADIKWIKVAVDLFDDEKIMLISALPGGDAMIIIWLKLLCLAGKQNNGGVFRLGGIPYTSEMLAAVLRRPVKQVTKALGTFEQLGLTKMVDGVITIPNWGKHQTMIDKNEYMRDYMREYRAKSKQSNSEVNKQAGELDERKTNVSPNVNEMLGDKKKEKEIEKKEPPYGGKKEKPDRFTQPTLEEVAAYCRERGNGVDPEHFMDHYSAIGWKIGKAPMKDWKAAVRTWEKHQRSYRDSRDEEDKWFDAG